MTSVRMTPELRRVIALPRKRPTDARALVDFWTSVLRAPNGKQTLNETQAQAVETAWGSQRGLYGVLSVGEGKTLLAFLLMTLFEAERGVVVAPSGMLDEMTSMHTSYREHWLSPPRPPELVAIEDLDRAEDNPFADLRPDVLALDEAHRFRRRSRVAGKHVARYLKVSRPRFVSTLTGTPGRLSVLDQAHQLVWCLDDGAPVPRGYHEQSIWAAALDEKGRFHGGVGVLRDLGGEGPTLKARAQDWYRQRVADTPGVIVSSRDSCDKALTIRHVVPTPDTQIEADFARWRLEFETPGGMTLSDPLSGFRLEGDLGLGYYRVFDPPPPPAWLRARKAVNRFIRAQVENSQRARKPLDTDARVLRAYPDAAPVVAWQAIGPTYKPRAKVVWRSASVVDFVARWVREHGPALVYCWSIPFCEALARATGLTWYGKKGLDARGRYLSNADAGASAIVSGQANIEGRNLPQFHRALYVMPPQSAQWLEQAFGRMHRQNQQHDVEINLLIASARTLWGFDAAIGEAEFGKTTFGVAQKIKRATILRATLPTGTYRWC